MTPMTTILGRIGSISKPKKISDSSSVVNISIARNSSVKNENGEYQTHWYNIQAWGKLGEALYQNVKVGQIFSGRVLIENNLFSKNLERKYELILILKEFQSYDTNKAPEINHTINDIAW